MRLHVPHSLISAFRFLESVPAGGAGRRRRTSNHDDGGTRVDGPSSSSVRRRGRRGIQVPVCWGLEWPVSALEKFTRARGSRTGTEFLRNFSKLIAYRTQCMRLIDKAQDKTSARGASAGSLGSPVPSGSGLNAVNTTEPHQNMPKAPCCAGWALRIAVSVTSSRTFSASFCEWFILLMQRLMSGAGL